jgi:hypothetical protein
MKALFSTFADCEEDEAEEEADAGAGADDDIIDSLAMTEGAYMSMLNAIGVIGESVPLATVQLRHARQLLLLVSAAKIRSSGRREFRHKLFHFADDGPMEEPTERNKVLARKAAAPQIGQGAGSDVLTRAEASLAFKLAQSEDEGGATDDLPVEGLDELDFQECIEAFAHVALGKWEDPDVNLGSKMAWLVDMIEEWLDTNGVTYNKDAALMEI